MSDVNPNPRTWRCDDTIIDLARVAFVSVEPETGNTRVAFDVGHDFDWTFGFNKDQHESLLRALETYWSLR